MNPLPNSLAAQGLSLPPMRGKTLSPDMAAFLTGTDLDDDTSGRGAKLVSPYSQSAWVYIAINRLAQKISSIPFRISQAGGDKAKRVRQWRGSADPRKRQFVQMALNEEIVESGDVVDLFDNPHPLMNRQLFWEMVVTWMMLRGEFFILPLDTSDTPVDLSDRAPRVQRMITLPTELFWHIVQGYELVAWRYTGSPLITPIPSEILEPSQVIHSRNPNPYLFWRGMSPLLVAMVAAGADYAASQYNKGYWLNNADTGVIVTTEQQVTPEQRVAILAALRERKRKAGTADRPLFLWGGAKVEKPLLSGMEQQFVENRKMNRQEIGAIFETPESVMGFTDQKSSALSGGGSAINQDMISWIENTVEPKCAHIEAAVAPIIRTFGENLIGWFDVESLPIMQQARRDRLDAATKAFGIGASFNDVNQLYDLGFPNYPGFGEKHYLPFSLQDTDAEPSMPSEEPPADGNKKPGQKPGEDEEANKSNPIARLSHLLSAVNAQPSPAVRAPDTKLIWQSHMKSRRKAVKLMQGKVGKVLMQYRGKTLAKLAEIHLQKDFDARKRGLIDLIFNQHDFGASLFVELHNPILSTLQAAGDELNKELGIDDPWSMPPRKALEFLASREQAIKGVGGTVRDQLNTSLQEGLDNGETHAQLADRVKAVYNDLSDYEADRVARTETNMAYNNARHDAMKSAGIAYKAWLSSHGPHVRPAHAAAEDAYIDDPIPVDDPFEVAGEQLMYPGDDSLGASLSNIINCQCVQLAAEKKSEDEKSITYKIFGAGEMTFSKN